MLPSAGSTNRKLRWTRYVAGFVLLLAPLLTEPFLHGLGQEKSAKSRHGMVVAVSPAGGGGRARHPPQGRQRRRCRRGHGLRHGRHLSRRRQHRRRRLHGHPPPAGEKDGVKREPVVIEYRETAPLAATATMFKKGDTWYTHKCVGVPGTVRGLALAHARFGKLPWKDVLLPAVQLAEDGFLLDRTIWPARSTP